MKPSALFSFHGLTGNQVTYVNHVTELTNLSGSFYTFEQTFCFFVQNVQTVPGTYHTQVAPNDTYLGFHDLVHLFHTLGNQDTFFIADGTFCIPFRNIFIEIVTVEYAEGMFGC